MKTEELIKLLGQLANFDTSDGCLIEDHPCSIAINRIKELEEWQNTALELGKKNNELKKAIRESSILLNNSRNIGIVEQKFKQLLEK